MYSLSTLRRRAHKIGYHISKGYQHFLNGTTNPVFYNVYGERFEGYSVLNVDVNCYVWGCYDGVFDNLWDIEDVEEFLKEEYEALGLTW